MTIKPMSRARVYRYFSCDFETTVYKGQERTDVWASAVVEFGTEDVEIFHSIEETFDYFFSLKSNLILYYHNLKFDGSFIVNHLLNVGYEQAVVKIDNSNFNLYFTDDRKMRDNTFKYSISDMGKWFTIKIKKNGYMIVFRDSLKMLPFSVRQIGKAFNTKHQKLDMEYEGVRYPGCKITDEEKEYIKNDVLVVKEAMEIMQSQGHTELTIGSSCLNEFKSFFGSKKDYDNIFPDLTKVWIDPKRHKYDNADAWIRKSYKGGWCYVVPEKAGKIFDHGLTADVNSLYPSVMHSMSGNYYPVGLPRFWTGNFIPDEALENNRYFFVRFKCRFYIREGHLPFVQIKGSNLYKSTEVLTTSDIKDKKTGKYNSFYIDSEGNKIPAIVELTFTQTEFQLFFNHYDLTDFEIIDGCYFESVIGVFDEYIDKYRKIKMESKGAMRTLAKLFLNNLYGKMASSTNSSFKYAYLKEDGSLGFYTIDADDKTPGYIAIGSAITGYAREFTITHAQENYYGADQEGFAYADTDSLHCDLYPNQLVNIDEHPTEFLHWSIESCWDEAVFVRAKTYVEHVTHVDLKEIDEPYYDIKCAGMPDRAKNYLLESMQGIVNTENGKEVERFTSTKRNIKDFTYGLKVPGKLVPKQIAGGVVLVETDYEIRR